MPEIFKLIFFSALIWNLIYLFSYGAYEKKQKNYLGIVGICLLLTAVFSLFLLNFISY